MNNSKSKFSLINSFALLLTIFILPYTLDASPKAVEEWMQWDEVAGEWQEKIPEEEGPANRLLAYLLCAQRAFVNQSIAKTGKFSGSLDPVSEKIFILFFPDYQPQKRKTDPFSEELASQVMETFAARYREEQAEIHPVKINLTKDTWKGKVPYRGLSVSTMKPWVIKRADQFRPAAPPPPDDPFWKQQLDEVKRAMAQASPEQKERIHFWAREKPFAGDWVYIGSDYMKKKNVPLEKQIEVREKLAQAILDSTIAVYDAKYTYLVRRPNMLDPDLKPYIKTPNHPSFPAGHSVTAYTAATLLSFYFPENQEEWERLAEESGLTRIWAGIHFPVDHAAGKALGRQIANAYISEGLSPSSAKPSPNSPEE